MAGPDRNPSAAGLIDAALRVVDEQFDATAGAPSFEDVVAAAFGGMVWAARQSPPPPLDALAEPAVAQSISAPVLDAVTDSVARRLGASASATGRDLADPLALADTFVRLGYSLVVVPDPAHPMATRGDVEAYARRYLVPLATAAAAPVPMPTPAPASTPVSLRRRSLRMVPVLTLTLFLGSGALAAALVQPWSAPVSPIDTDDRGTTPAPSDDGATLAPPVGEPGDGAAVAPLPASEVRTQAPAPTATLPSPADLPTVYVQPSSSRGTPGSNDSRMPPPQGFPPPGLRPFGPPPPGSAPTPPSSFAPGTPAAPPPGFPRRPGPPSGGPGIPGAPGTPGAPGSGPHPGGPGGGPP